MNDLYARTNNICLVFLTIVAATGALHYMKPVLIPLIFAVFTYAVLTPLVKWVERKTKVPKVFAILLSMIVLFLLLTLIVLVLIHSIESFVVAVPKYQNSIDQFLKYIEMNLLIFDVDLEVEKIGQILKKLPVFSYAQSMTGRILTFLGNLFLVFIFTVFMMTGESRTERKSPFLNQILFKVSAYISTKFFLSLMTGLLVWVVLLVFGVELAFLFALLTILLNFIPTIGSIAAVILPLPIVFLQYQLGAPFFAVLSLTGIIQFVIGNVIEPKLLGDSMDLHPIVVLMCLVFWGMIWGVAGMFLAVPITAVLKIIFTKIEATQVLAEILGGRLPDRN